MQMKVRWQELLIKKKRMEAVKIKLSDFDGNSGLTYRTHVSDVGWQNWVSSNERAGTEGQNKPIEAIEISLSRTMSDFLISIIECMFPIWVG